MVTTWATGNGSVPQSPRHVTVSQDELNNLKHKLEERARAIKDYYVGREAAIKAQANKQYQAQKEKLYRRHIELAKREAQIAEREHAVTKAAERLKREAQVVNEFKRRNVGKQGQQPQTQPKTKFRTQTQPQPQPKPQPPREPLPYSKEWYEQGYQYRGGGPQQRSKQVKTGRQGRDSSGRFTKKATSTENYQVYGPRGGGKARPRQMSFNEYQERLYQQVRAQGEYQEFQRHQQIEQRAEEVKAAVARGFQGVWKGVQWAGRETNWTIRNAVYEAKGRFDQWQRTRALLRQARDNQPS